MIRICISHFVTVLMFLFTRAPHYIPGSRAPEHSLMTSLGESELHQALQPALAHTQAVNCYQAVCSLLSL